MADMDDNWNYAQYFVGEKKQSLRRSDRSEFFGSSKGVDRGRSPPVAMRMAAV